MKKLTPLDQHTSDKIIIQEINHLTDEEQSEKLAEHFSSILSQYEQLNKEDISIDQIVAEKIPQFKEVQVWDLLIQLKTNKSTVKGDISAKVYKELAAYIAEPLTHVYNISLLKG